MGTHAPLILENTRPGFAGKKPTKIRMNGLSQKRVEKGCLVLTMPSTKEAP